jgi:predicted nucleic acid-binding protein
MPAFLLDASALVKRYANETGSAVVDYLFAHTARDRLMCLMLGAAEVAAALVRKPNGGLTGILWCWLHPTNAYCKRHRQRGF